MRHKNGAQQEWRAIGMALQYTKAALTHRGEWKAALTVQPFRSTDGQRAIRMSRHQNGALHNSDSNPLLYKWGHYIQGIKECQDGVYTLDSKRRTCLRCCVFNHLT